MSRRHAFGIIAIYWHVGRRYRASALTSCALTWTALAGSCCTAFVLRSLKISAVAYEDDDQRMRYGGT